MSGSASSSAVRTVARSRVRRRWRELVAIGLVAGVVAGLAIAAAAGARRSSTAYDRLLAASDFPDVFVQLVEPRPGLADEVAELPSVERAVPSVFAVGQRTDAPGHVLLPVQTSAQPTADLPVIDGRAPDPGAADEVVLSHRFAEQLELEIGDVISHRTLTDDEFADLLRDRWDGSVSGIESELRVVGLVRTPTDVALAEFPTLTGTPALHERLDAAVDGSVGVWVHLRPGADAASLDADLAAVAGEGSEERLDGFSTIDLAAARRAVDGPVAVLAAGMAVFGALVALAGVMVVAQLAGRAADDARPDGAALEVLGLDRRSRRRAWLLTGWPALATAVVTASVVAASASVATPLGVARSIEPDPGVDLNVAFVAGGLTVLIASLAGVWMLAGRSRPPAVRRGTRRSARLGAASGPAATVAVSMALAPGERRGGRWLGIAGVGTSVLGIVAASVFGSSLGDLVDEPRRWGWFGDLSIEVPEPARADVYAALDAAPEVDGYAEVRTVEVTVEGRTVAGYSVTPRRGSVSPVVLRGRPPQAGEIALGPRLAEDLGVGIGDRVRTDAGTRTVVGVAPTFGMSDLSDNVSGALLGGPIEDAEFTTAVVRVADGVDAARFGEVVYPDAEYGAPVAPTDVVNLRELEALPPLLLATFALLGLAAIAHLARSTADRTRRDVAVLRALGLPRRAAARTVLGATAIAAFVATAVAAPVGAIAGARGWSLVAAGTDLAAGASAPAALAAAFPALALFVGVAGAAAGRRAVARMPGPVLRSE